MVESSLSKLDDKGVFTIVKVENVERKVCKETITEVNIKTEEVFDGVKNFYTSRKMIVAKFYDNGKPTILSQDIQRGENIEWKSSPRNLVMVRKIMTLQSPNFVIIS